MSGSRRSTARICRLAASSIRPLTFQVRIFTRPTLSAVLLRRPTPLPHLAVLVGSRLLRGPDLVLDHSQ